MTRFLRSFLNNSLSGDTSIYSGRSSRLKTKYFCVFFTTLSVLTFSKYSEIEFSNKFPLIVFVFTVISPFFILSQYWKGVIYSLYPKIIPIFEELSLNDSFLCFNHSSLFLKTIFCIITNCYLNIRHVLILHLLVYIGRTSTLTQ